MTSTPQRGFTLIELSIVLVIIGLIVGGILVGRDLIKAAEIRGTITQVEQLNTAVNTFKLKYNRSLPGDITSADAATFGLTARSGAAGHGDGNGILESCANGVSATLIGCETALFWNDLSSANLVNGSFTTATDAALTSTAGLQKLYFPVAKILSSSSIVVFYSPVTNHLGTATDMGFASHYFAIVDQFAIDVSGVISMQPAFSALEAKLIDDKIDDGFPATGRVRPLARSPTDLSQGEAINDIPGADSGFCIQSTGGYIYPPTQNVRRCNLTIQAQF